MQLFAYSFKYLLRKLQIRRDNWTFCDTSGLYERANCLAESWCSIHRDFQQLCRDIIGNSRETCLDNPVRRFHWNGSEPRRHTNGRLKSSNRVVDSITRAIAPINTNIILFAFTTRRSRVDRNLTERRIRFLLQEKWRDVARDCVHPARAIWVTRYWTFDTSGLLFACV